MLATDWGVKVCMTRALCLPAAQQAGSQPGGKEEAGWEAGRQESDGVESGQGAWPAHDRGG